MSSLIVASDLDLMMLEISIEELVVPRVSDFDSALMKKTVVMFRMLDKDWTSVYPQRRDYRVYRGSNCDREPFNGGVSVVFPIPQSSLDREIDRVDLQLHVRRDLSKYFEVGPSENVGIACVDVSDLFNGVIGDLKNREGRQPVARSSKRTYKLVDEDGSESEASVTVYLRLSHLGNSVISEIDVPDDAKIRFYAKEETTGGLPYQFRELDEKELTGGCWGSATLLLPPGDLVGDTVCRCDKSNVDESPTRIKESELDAGGEESAQGDQKASKIRDDRDYDEVKEEGVEEGIKRGDRDEAVINGKKKKEKKNGNGIKYSEEKKETVETVETVAEKKKKNKKKDEEEEEEEGNGKGLNDDDEASGVVSCLVKPAFCGREGTCSKKDGKGKFGKCGKPDGEGGSPLSCGEKRKCARRRMTAGSGTVGIVDKKIPNPCSRPDVNQNSCFCTEVGRSFTATAAPHNDTSTSPCGRCQPAVLCCGHNCELLGATRYLNFYSETNGPAAAGCRTLRAAGWP